MMRSISAWLAATFVMALAAASAAKAADAVPFVTKAPPAPASSWTFEAGARYWYSSGKNWFDYYNDATTTQLNSSLTYDKLRAQTGEVFFRVDAPYRLFLKGYIGGGSHNDGNLFDEDFPPAVTPYTKTISDARGRLSYAVVDLGYSFYDGRAPVVDRLRLGAFAGYHYWHERTDAYGCQQIGGGNVCDGVNALPTSTLVITEEDRWRAARLGLIADIWMTQNLKLSTEGAYASVRQAATDTHYLTFGPAPASGDGKGVELESILSYQLTNVFNIGLGGRWWHYKTEAFDVNNQLLRYTTNRYGMFLQAGARF